MELSNTIETRLIRSWTMIEFTMGHTCFTPCSNYNVCSLYFSRRDARGIKLTFVFMKLQNNVSIMTTYPSTLHEWTFFLFFGGLFSISLYLNILFDPAPSGAITSIVLAYLPFSYPWMNYTRVTTRHVVTIRNHFSILVYLGGWRGPWARDASLIRGALFH